MWEYPKEVKKLYSHLCEELGIQEIKPFLRNEAIQFLNVVNVDEPLHDMIIDKAGTTPRMLMKYRNVHDTEKYTVCNVRMNQDIDDLIYHLKDALCNYSQKYASSVPKSLIWLSRASTQDEVLEDEIEGSYVAQEFLTYLREEENAKLFMSGLSPLAASSFF